MLQWRTEFSCRKNCPAFGRRDLVECSYNKLIQAESKLIIEIYKNAIVLPPISLTSQVAKGTEKLKISLRIFRQHRYHIQVSLI